MRVFQANYARSYGWCAFEEAEYVIVANTESEALGLALEARRDSSAEGWSIEEINIAVPSAHYISSRAS